jgi:hypothetical protein
MVRVSSAAGAGDALSTATAAISISLNMVIHPPLDRDFPG